MEPLIKITSVPITVEMKSTGARSNESLIVWSLASVERRAEDFGLNQSLSNCESIPLRHETPLFRQQDEVLSKRRREEKMLRMKQQQSWAGRARCLWMQD